MTSEANGFKRTRNTFILQSWVSNNVFDDSLADSVLYVLFYILVPVVVTIFGLPEGTRNTAINRIYFYVTILISAANCIYDAYGRMKDRARSVKNTKLFLMCIPVAITGGYCAIEIMRIVIRGVPNSYPDLFLCSFFISAAIALSDCFAIIISRMVFVEERVIGEAFGKTNS